MRRSLSLPPPIRETLTLPPPIRGDPHFASINDGGPITISSLMSRDPSVKLY
jgi:hypothetical protein